MAVRPPISFPIAFQKANYFTKEEANATLPSTCAATLGMEVAGLQRGTCFAFGLLSTLPTFGHRPLWGMAATRATSGALHLQQPTADFRWHAICTISWRRE
jgi:hypothetical protein